MKFKNKWMVCINPTNKVGFEELIMSEEQYQEFIDTEGCMAELKFYHANSKLHAYEILARECGNKVIHPTKVNECAMDKFIHGIEVVYDTMDDDGTICGISLGTPFWCSTKEFNWNGIKARRIRGNMHKIASLPTPVKANGKMTNSDITLESLYYFLWEVVVNRMSRSSYFGICANDMSNNAAQGLEINPEWLEEATRDENLCVGRLWNRVFKRTGLRLIIPARDYKFLAYCNAVRGKLTSEYVLSYKGIDRECPIIWDGEVYYRVYPPLDEA